MEKILTLIIPTYNMEDYLDKCLTSLVIEDKELMGALEVLVINDGSKDSSLEIARKYQTSFPEVFFVIDKENGNYGSCINRGLKEATGKYIKVLDADDSFDTENLQSFIATLQDLDADLVVSDVILVNELAEMSSATTINIPAKCYLDIDVCIHALSSIQMHSVTYRTQNLREINYYQEEGISYTDQLWMFIPMTKVNTIYYFNKVLYRYLVGRVGQTTDINVSIRSIDQKLRILELMLEKMQDYSADLKYEVYLQTRCYNALKEVYKLILVCQNSQKPLNDLSRIDDDIKKYYYNIWQQLEEEVVSERLKIRYIKHWHHCRSMSEYSMGFKVLNFIYRLSAFISRS